jgi:hypothetical protein
LKAGWLPVLVGCWLGALLASWVGATVNFRTVDRVLGQGMRAELQHRMAAIPADERRVVLRHLASEINRWVFRYWSLAQMVLGAACLIASLRLGGPSRLLLAGALLIVLVQGFGLAAPITDLGRSIDFVPRPLPPDTARRFGMLHAAFVGLDLVKALLLVIAAWAVARRLT